MADTDLFRLSPNECMITNPTGTQQAIILVESLDTWLAQGWTKWAKGVPTNPKPGMNFTVKHFR